MLDEEVPEYKAIMAPLPAVIKVEALLPKIILFAVLEASSLKPAASLMAGVDVFDEVLVVVTLLLTVRLPVIVLTNMVPVDERPE